MNIFKSRLTNVLKELAEELAEERLAKNRLMAVCGMNIEELTDAFTKGYRLVSPKGGVPDDLRIVPKNAREQTNWIPASKRLPEENKYYLTTTMYHEVYCDYWGGKSFNRTEEIIAWMPLPKPYKAESEG